MARTVVLIANKVAEADTGASYVLNVPSWAKRMLVSMRVSAVAGTTPVANFVVEQGDPDAGAWVTVLTGDSLTAAGNVFGMIGSTAAISGTNYDAVGGKPSRYMRVRTVLDRVTGDETYTHKIWVEYQD